MSDHIPDLTKMIGETPRTDESEYGDIGISNFGHQDLCDAYKFARQLERELNAVSKERDEAVFVTEKVLKEFSEHSRSRCKAIDELNAANERIKQWHNALTPLMPSDFKCWHENTPNEWPEVAAWVITSQRERIKRLESWIESLEVLEQHSGILPEREWFGSEIGYLRKGEAVYKGEAKP